MLLKNVCNKKGINIGHIAPYIHKGNVIAECYWKTLPIMKDLLLIDNRLIVNFGAKVMDISNYLCNQLSTRRNSPDFIPKEAWTSKTQNLEHVQIFGRRINIFILIEKQTKSDIQKTWKGILIGYISNSKYLKVWVSCIYSVLIASGPIINKSKRSANLFLEHPLSPTKKSFQP